MTNLLTLLKVYFRESFDKRKFKQDKKQQTFLAYVLIMASVFVVLSSLYSAFYAQSYVEAGMSNKLYNLTIIFFIVSSLMVFSSSISKIGSIFLGNDYDILSAMPIRKSTIVLAKIINLYISEVVVCLILLIPNSIISTIFTQNTRYLVVIPLSLIAPAYPMLLALFITAIIELFVKNPKVKNIISIVLMLGISIFIFVGTFVMGFLSGENNGDLTTMFNSLSDKSVFINPTLLFAIWGFEKRFRWFALFVLANLVILVVVLGIIILAYNKIHSNMKITNISSERNKNKQITYKANSETKAMFIATARQFVKSKNAVVQCVLGVVMSILSSVGLVIIFTQLTTNMNGEEIILADRFRDYIFIFTMGITFFLSMMPPSAFLISLEGKNLFILKTYPISFKSYLKSKLLFSLIFMGISTFATIITIIIFVRQSIFSLIISIIFPFTFMVFIALFTLIINSLFPYLNWKDDIEVFKNHKSSIITTFSDMGISLTSVLVALGLSLITPYISGVLMVLVFVGLDIFLYHILMTKIPSRLEKLEMNE